MESKFRTLDDIFSIEAGSAHYLLRLNGFQAQLAHLCDIQRKAAILLLQRARHLIFFFYKYVELSSDMHVYRFNKEKALEWLQRKVNQLVPSFGTVPLLQSSVAEALEKASTEQEKTGKAVFTVRQPFSDAEGHRLVSPRGRVPAVKISQHVVVQGTLRPSGVCGGALATDNISLF